MTTDIPFLLGIVGMLCILAGFFLVQSHRWSQDSLQYDVLNFIGSGLLIIYAVDGRAWPFLALNAVWALYSLKDIVSDIRHPPKVVRKAG